MSREGQRIASTVRYNQFALIPFEESNLVVDINGKPIHTMSLSLDTLNLFIDQTAV